MPRPISLQKFLVVQPIAIIGSPLRRIKKRIRHTRERSRKMVELDISMKFTLPCPAMKNEKTSDGRIRKRKTASSISWSLGPEYDGRFPIAGLFRSSDMRILPSLSPAVTRHYRYESTTGKTLSPRLILVECTFSFNFLTRSSYEAELMISSNWVL